MHRPMQPMFLRSDKRVAGSATSDHDKENIKNTTNSGVMKLSQTPRVARGSDVHMHSPLHAKSALTSTDSAGRSTLSLVPPLRLRVLEKEQDARLPQVMFWSPDGVRSQGETESRPQSSGKKSVKSDECSMGSVGSGNKFNAGFDEELRGILWKQYKKANEGIVVASKPTPSKATAKSIRARNQSPSHPSGDSWHDPRTSEDSGRVKQVLEFHEALVTPRKRAEDCPGSHDQACPSTGVDINTYAGEASSEISHVQMAKHQNELPIEAPTCQSGSLLFDLSPMESSHNLTSLTPSFPPAVCGEPLVSFCHSPQLAQMENFRSGPTRGGVCTAMASMENGEKSLESSEFQKQLDLKITPSPPSIPGTSDCVFVTNEDISGGHKLAREKLMQSDVQVFLDASLVPDTRAEIMYGTGNICQRHTPRVVAVTPVANQRRETRFPQRDEKTEERNLLTHQGTWCSTPDIQKLCQTRRDSLLENKVFQSALTYFKEVLTLGRLRRFWRIWIKTLSQRATTNPEPRTIAGLQADAPFREDPGMHTVYHPRQALFTPGQHYNVIRHDKPSRPEARTIVDLQADAPSREDPGIYAVHRQAPNNQWQQYHAEQEMQRFKQEMPLRPDAQKIAYLQVDPPFGDEKARRRSYPKRPPSNRLTPGQQHHAYQAMPQKQQQPKQAMAPITTSGRTIADLQADVPSCDDPGIRAVYRQAPSNGWKPAQYLANQEMQQLKQEMSQRPAVSGPDARTMDYLQADVPLQGCRPSHPRQAKSSFAAILSFPEEIRKDPLQKSLHSQPCLGQSSQGRILAEGAIATLIHGRADANVSETFHRPDPVSSSQFEPATLSMPMDEMYLPRISFMGSKHRFSDHVQKSANVSETFHQPEPVVSSQFEPATLSIPMDEMCLPRIWFPDHVQKSANVSEACHRPDPVSSSQFEPATLSIPRDEMYLSRISHVGSQHRFSTHLPPLFETSNDGASSEVGAVQDQPQREIFVSAPVHLSQICKKRNGKVIAHQSTDNGNIDFQQPQPDSGSMLQGFTWERDSRMSGQRLQAITPNGSIKYVSMPSDDQCGDAGRCTVGIGVDECILGYSQTHSYTNRGIPQPRGWKPEQSQSCPSYPHRNVERSQAVMAAERWQRQSEALSQRVQEVLTQTTRRSSASIFGYQGTGFRC